MPQDTELQRCFEFVTLLNAEHGWELTPQSQLDYARQIAACCANLTDTSDARICAMLRYYHKDHALVDALRDTTNREHSDRWADWTSQAIRFLAAKTAGTFGGDDIATSLEDLAQEAIHDLWRGLATFSYQSSFQTWAFTIIGHCLARHYRALATQKRGAFSPTHSLDMLLTAGDIFDDRGTPSLDELAFGDMLAELVQNVLDQHPDRRLAIIFQLWASEEQTLRTIGDQLDLSVARVHALLKQAIALLHNELAIQDWARIDTSGVLVA
jgi:RNA polymerase sigma factor (sigma-70 family)